MLLPRIVALCFLLIATESRAGTAAPAGTVGTAATPGSASSCDRVVQVAARRRVKKKVRSKKNKKEM